MFLKTHALLFMLDLSTVNFQTVIVDFVFMRNSPSYFEPINDMGLFFFIYLITFILDKTDASQSTQQFNLAKLEQNEN